MIETRMKKFQSKFVAFKLYRNKLGVFGTLLYILKRLTTRKGGLISLKILNGGKLYLRNGFYDTAIFSQIFIYEDLNFPLSPQPRIIIDCGANIGLATLYFKFKYPNAQIISIEPEASNFSMLKKNTEPYKDVHLLKNGIWYKTCTLYLVDTGEGHASFQVTENPHKKNVLAEINAVSIDDIILKFHLNNIDLVKMDIEGSEYDCFKSKNVEWVKKASSIAIEIHEHIHPGCKALIDRSLSDREYQLNGEYHIYDKPAIV